MQSGIRRLPDQSPPPMTFPALAVDIPTTSLLFLKKLSLYALVIISVDALDALYGSTPPNKSVSLKPIDELLLS